MYDKLTFLRVKNGVKISILFGKWYCETGKDEIDAVKRLCDGLRDEAVNDELCQHLMKAFRLDYPVNNPTKKILSVDYLYRENSVID